jgi:hypothetical protein
VEHIFRRKFAITFAQKRRIVNCYIQLVGYESTVTEIFILKRLYDKDYVTAMIQPSYGPYENFNTRHSNLELNELLCAISCLLPKLRHVNNYSVIVKYPLTVPYRKIPRFIVLPYLPARLPKVIQRDFILTLEVNIDPMQNSNPSNEKPHTGTSYYANLPSCVEIGWKAAFPRTIIAFVTAVVSSNLVSK